MAAISRDDVATGGRALDGIAAIEVYEASVSVLMRLVFLLFAEERRLLPAEDPLWAESYSVLTLREDLRTAAIARRRGCPRTSLNRVAPPASHLPGRTRRRQPRPSHPPCIRRKPLRPRPVPISRRPLRA